MRDSNLRTWGNVSEVFRRHKSMEDETVAPKTHNIVATAYLGDESKLDLRVIAGKIRNAEFNPKRFSALIMRIQLPKSTAMIFASGKMVVTGARSEEDAKFACRKFARIIQKIGFNVKFEQFKVRTMVGGIDVGFPIRLEDLSKAHAPHCTYEPEIFPGLIYRLTDPKVTQEDLVAAYDKIAPVLAQYKKTSWKLLLTTCLLAEPKWQITRGSWVRISPVYSLEDHFKPPSRGNILKPNTQLLLWTLVLICLISSPRAKDTLQPSTDLTRTKRLASLNQKHVSSRSAPDVESSRSHQQGHTADGYDLDFYGLAAVKIKSAEDERVGVWYRAVQRNEWAAIKATIEKYSPPPIQTAPAGLYGALQTSQALARIAAAERGLFGCVS
ncbi:hypothetical protein PROFUN_10137 [Planoprotostelium fungivorum]|uniref:TATA-box-binding protein n=1 Tax=Planoprotostelium fungivorum TaxID=1890364 RepID=A0A2P6NEQ7_9EUKA|nr:hypothetical protein PROFUN_10137 [Planoprotostelium fungivorum]